MITASQEVRFEVSTLCNYHCKMCPRERMTRPIKIMPNGLFADLLQKIMKECPRQFNYLTFSGMGEPLMDKDLAEKVRIAWRGYGLRTIVVTNGAFLSPGVFEKLQSAGLDFIRVSFHSIDGTDYVAKHGSNRMRYELIRWSLKNIINNLKVTTRIGIYYTLPEASQETIKALEKKWKGVDVLEIWRPHNWSDAFKFREVQERKVDCNRLERGPLQIQVDGTINACCFDYAGKTEFGDLKKESLARAFERGHRYKKSCKEYAELCARCDQMNEDKKDALIYSTCKINDNEPREGRTSTAFVKI